MKPYANTIVVAVALMSICVSLLAYFKRGDDDEPPRGKRREITSPPLGAIPVSDGISEAIEQRLARLENALGSKPAADGGDTGASIDDRFARLESSIAKLQSAFEGISLEDASEEREASFRGEDGHLRADEYFAANKFAIAGEGYLAFLEAHPDHPDAYDVLKRASRSFRRAGYLDKAIWAQEELMTNLGERRSPDVLDLAQLQKDAGGLDEAIASAAEAAELATAPQQALWDRAYRAWFNQLRDGNQAGIDAYRQVEQEITAGGFTDHKLGERVREKIAEIERLQSAGQ